MTVERNHKRRQIPQQYTILGRFTSFTEIINDTQMTVERNHERRQIPQQYTTLGRFTSFTEIINDTQMTVEKNKTFTQIQPPSRSDVGFASYEAKPSCHPI